VDRVLTGSKLACIVRRGFCMLSGLAAVALCACGASSSSVQTTPASVATSTRTASSTTNHRSTSASAAAPSGLAANTCDLFTDAQVAQIVGRTVTGHYYAPLAHQCVWKLAGDSSVPLGYEAEVGVFSGQGVSCGHPGGLTGPLFTAGDWKGCEGDGLVNVGDRWGALMIGLSPQLPGLNHFAEAVLAKIGG